MTTGDRVLDPDAIREFQQFIQEKLDQLNDDIVPVLRNGDLSYAPAFGRMTSSYNAKSEYNRFFTATWDNIQQLRGIYSKMLDELDAALEAHGESETLNTSDNTNIDGQMEN